MVAAPEQGRAEHRQGGGSPADRAGLQFELSGPERGSLGRGQIAGCVVPGCLEDGDAGFHGGGPAAEGSIEDGGPGRGQPGLHLLRGVEVVGGEAAD